VNQPEQSSEHRPTAFRMTLFIAGSEPNSCRARENLLQLCEKAFQNDYELTVIDVLEDYQAAIANHVMVTPTLIIQEPLPRVTILGDLRDSERLRRALRLSSE